MKYLTFKKEVKWAVANDNKYDLLGLFVTDTKYEIVETIQNLESVLKGEKVFDDIQDPDMSWSFGNVSGYFEVEGETAYFEPFEDTTDSPRIVMPLKELIDVLKEWKSFLDSNS